MLRVLIGLLLITSSACIVHAEKTQAEKDRERALFTTADGYYYGYREKVTEADKREWERRREISNRERREAYEKRQANPSECERNGGCSISK